MSSQSKLLPKMTVKNELSDGVSRDPAVKEAYNNDPYVLHKFSLTSTISELHQSNNFKENIIINTAFNYTKQVFVYYFMVIHDFWHGAWGVNIVTVAQTCLFKRICSIDLDLGERSSKFEIVPNQTRACQVTTTGFPMHC